jgi:hypothetical protein
MIIILFKKVVKKVYKKSANVNKKIKNSLIFADSHKQVHK